MVLCDTEEEYAQLFTEFLRKQNNLPWEIHTYTNPESLLSLTEEQMDFLVISETAYGEELLRYSSARVVILNESGIIRWKEVAYVDKYQPADEVFRFLLQFYAEFAGYEFPRMQKKNDTAIWAFYSPVHRSCQTSVALAMGQMLSRTHSVLYVNFEAYAGIGELLPNFAVHDLGDLLYFMSAKQEQFYLRLQSIVRHIDTMSYIPPIKSGQNLLSIHAEEWLRLLNKLDETGEYEYIILDLSDCVQGLFDILKLSEKIFTLYEEDGVAAGKLLQYRHLLQVQGSEDIWSRTKKLPAPRINRVPADIVQYGRGELASFVEKMLEE